MLQVCASCLGREPLAPPQARPHCSGLQEWEAVHPATGRGCGGCGRRIRQVGTGHRYEETDRDEVGAFALSVGNIDKASKPI